MRRNLRRFDFAAPTPEDVRVRDWNPARIKMPINSSFVLQQQLFVGAVRHGHDVDVSEFRAGLAPVTMRQDMMSANFAARSNFAAGRYCPMKQRVESRHT